MKTLSSNIIIIIKEKNGIFLILILNHVPTIKKYDIIKLTFYSHFRIFSVKRLDLKQVFSPENIERMFEQSNLNIYFRDLPIQY